MSDVALLNESPQTLYAASRRARAIGESLIDGVHPMSHRMITQWAGQWYFAGKRVGAKDKKLRKFCEIWSRILVPTVL